MTVAEAIARWLAADERTRIPRVEPQHVALMNARMARKRAELLRESTSRQEA